MANVFVETADLSIISAMISASLVGTLKLFKNDHTPAVTDSASDYTEADFSGYGGSETPSWGTPFVNGANKGQVDADPIVYTHSGGGTSNTVYGAYVLDGSANLIYADRFPAPFLMAVGGDTFSYAPSFTCVSE